MQFWQKTGTVRDDRNNLKGSEVEVEVERNVS